MGRPSIYDRPMTGAERQRRSMDRLRRRAADAVPSDVIDVQIIEDIALDPDGMILLVVLSLARDTSPALQKALDRALENLAQVLQAIDLERDKSR